MEQFQDDFVLLSYINLKLRDEYSSLAELCADLQADQDEIELRLKKIGYNYDEKANAFK